jgi:hypothetical protein
MAVYIPPTSGAPVYPDIQTDWTPAAGAQPNGSPPNPGTAVTGPVLAGPIPRSDGSNTLAGVGGTATGTANRGYVQQAQACVVTQATNDGTAGQFACPIVIPAQSKILRMALTVTTIWSGGAATLGVGTSASATAFTAAGAVSAAALGVVEIPPQAAAGPLANWDNVGTQDVQIVLLSTNTGTGVGTLVVEYIPQINLAS